LGYGQGYDWLSSVSAPHFINTSTRLVWVRVSVRARLTDSVVWCKNRGDPPSSRLRVRVRDMLRFRVNFGVRVRVYAVWYKKGDLHLFDLTRFSTSLI